MSGGTSSAPGSHVIILSVQPVSFQDYKSTVIAFAVLAATLLLPSSLDELDKVGTEK